MNPRELLPEASTPRLSPPIRWQIVPHHLPAPPHGRTVVVGAGKAAGSMALAVERHWREHAPLEGVVITRYGHGLATRAHSRRRGGTSGSRRTRAKPPPARSSPRARSLREDDLLLVLVSGGGSSLLALPVDGVTMADLKAVTRDAARVRRADPGHEHGAQAPLGDPGRTARARRRRRACWRS